MGRREDLVPVVSVAFAAGAASATILWWTLFRKHVDNEDVQLEWFQRLEGIRSRARMQRWPSWQNVRRRGERSLDSEELIKTPVRPQDKTGLCIGSIFGMDVGGTLTKLVYFEQRTEVEPHLQMPTTDDSSKGGKMHLRRKTIADPWAFPSTADSSNGEPKEGAHVRGDSLPNMAEVPDLGLDGASRKSRPVFELNKSRDHAEALDSFYAFARGFSRFQSGVRDTELSFYSKELGGDFHFIQFETRQMEAAMDLIRSNKLHSSICEMGATGGGAHKYAAAWERVLGIKILKEDELDSLVAGMQFVLSTVMGECYTFRPRMPTDSSSSSTCEDEAPDSEHKMSEEEASSSSKGDEWWWSRKVKRDAISPSATYPYLLVTIGTGVSILRVDGPRKHVRVSGSTIGGGTYWGLIRLLTNIDDFENVLSLAERGDSSKADMMVGDIYGTDSKALEKVGLPSNLVASSFGKLVAKADPAEGLSKEDLARALLLMVTNNIGQVAYLNAKLNNTPRIYFVGNFLRNNKISQRRLSYAINYWSKGEMEALFLEREGYLGALGAFLLCQGISQTDSGFFQRDAENSSRSQDSD
jgi:type II pantothenate kinase